MAKGVAERSCNEKSHSERVALASMVMVMGGFYAECFRRRHQAKPKAPTAPIPKRVRLAGSGTGTEGTTGVVASPCPCCCGTVVGVRESAYFPGALVHNEVWLTTPEQTRPIRSSPRTAPINTDFSDRLLYRLMERLPSRMKHHCCNLFLYARNMPLAREKPMTFTDWSQLICSMCFATEEIFVLRAGQGCSAKKCTEMETIAVNLFMDGR